MRDAYKMLQARKGDISQEKYNKWKNQEKDYLELNKELSGLETALGSKLPILERKER
jgi:hypothetical protein